ncbi:hypothetical protein BJ875DRAFT_469031 [Amylocarpus encephaloides]|uniref:Zn(2)-C6 fungal-type domain-containing protein n=1 Tax=Amylocarpus encephaloides TaxID=45428 RepID=A0A9P8C2M9_9HELO|nr:hypothetical protein BJ875DRAFT_469031 [Amylocarpus encephaloides]
MSTSLETRKRAHQSGNSDEIRSASGRHQLTSFTCHICSNVYEKMKTRDRHIPYCRKRTVAPPPPRQVSCTACIMAKSRCDRKSPCYTTFYLKERECKYKNSQTETAPSTLISLSNPTSLIDTPAEEIMPLTPVPFPAQQAGFLFGSPFDFSTVDVDAIDNSLVVLQNTIDNSQYGRPLDNNPWALCNTSLNIGPSAPALQLTSGFSFLPNSLELGMSQVPSLGSMSFLIIKERRSLSTRKLPSVVSSANGQFILQTLRTYPRMMLRENNSPPFVHANCRKAICETESRESPLTRCINLIRMFYARTQHTAPLVWRAIRSEQDRLFHQSYSLSRGELLSAAQSICLYIFLRIIDGPTDDNNLDREFIYTLGRIFEYLHEVRPRYGNVLRKQTAKPSWEDWAFAESTNRVVILFYLLNMFLEIEDSCLDYGVIVAGAPLPCKKALWEAPDSEIWTQEYDLEGVEGRNYSMVSCGGLVELHHQSPRDQNCQALLDELYADVDGLGYLTLLSAALI